MQCSNETTQPVNLSPELLSCITGCIFNTGSSCAEMQVLCACRQLVFPLLKWFQVSVDKHAQLGELRVNDSLSLSDYQSALLEERHSQQDRYWGTSPDNWWVC